jgi:hypothetical protein
MDTLKSPPLHEKTENTSNTSHREGIVAKTIESQTAKWSFSEFLLCSLQPRKEGGLWH